MTLSTVASVRPARSGRKGKGVQTEVYNRGEVLTGFKLVNLTYRK